MARRVRCNHGAAFKAKAALEAVRGEKMLNELAQQFDLNANQSKQWKDQLLDGAEGLFGGRAVESVTPTIDLKTLHAKIGELTLANDFLSDALVKTGLPGARR